jgi:virulence factor Mce-like protein
MSDAMARLVAIFSALLLAAAVGTLWVTSHSHGGGATVRAEFDDVYPLLPGMHVRVDGAIAGQVESIEVADDGEAIVTMDLFDGTSPPRADASAAIRQQDITGDSYVALDLGTGAKPLGDTMITSRRTIVAPRFDDLLNSFDEPVRQGLKLILIEVGKGLERRGDDLNGAILALRPGLEAANEALSEVRSQNAALRGLVADAEAVTSQASSRTHELGQLIDSLSTTLTTTAQHSDGLDAALEKLPQTAADTRDVLAELTRFATDARPLARTLADSAPDLAVTLRRFGPFLDDAKATMDAVGPTLKLVENLLVKSLPTLRAAPDRVLTAPLDIAAAAGAVLDTLIGEPDLQKALFSADGYGSGPKSKDDVGLGAVAVEHGDQQGYEGNDPQRTFLRAETVLTCETFGQPIRPGCLDDAIAAMAHHGATAHGAGAGNAGSGDTAGGGGAGQPGSASPGGSGGSGSGSAGDQLGQTLDQVGGDVGDLLDQVGGVIGGATGGGGNGGGGGGGGGNGGGNLGDAEDLLDFLSGP